MINARARLLWEDYLAETDPDAAEMLCVAYLRALCEPEPDLEPVGISSRCIGNTLVLSLLLFWGPLAIAVLTW